MSATATQPPDHKVTICHATNSDTNPYVEESPDIAADGYLKGGGNEPQGHNGHTGPIWAAGMKADHDKWGDIIPPYDYGDFHYAGLNWTSLGQVILRNGCTIPAPTPTSVSTTVFDADTNAVWSGTEVAAASAYDTAVVAHTSALPVATGSVTYTFYSNNTCSGTGISAGTKTLDALGRVPKSDTQSDLGAGLYSFKAAYSGDSVYASSTSACEPFTVKSTPGGPKATVTTTTVFNDATDAAWSSPVQAPASAYDTAKVVTPSVFPRPTGTVTYTFFANNTCAVGTGSSAGTKTIGVDGTVPNSDTKAGLAAGSYAFQATYSGDDNYNGSTSACEPFTVNSTPGGPKATVTTTTVFNDATDAAWSAPVQAPAAAYDTAKVVTPSVFPVATGTVSYTFFSNNTCAVGTGSSAGTKTIDEDGTVPNSDTKSSLAAGSYAFQATYSGDKNYSGSTSECETFTVAGGPYNPATTTTTTIFNASTNAALTGQLALNGSVYDTSSVTHVGGLTPTGTISYTFWSNNSCSGDGVAAGTNLPLGTKSTTKGPLAAGSYSFKATFTSSDTTKFSNSVSSCEPFTVSNGEGGTGEVLAETGANPPGFGLAVTLLILGIFAMGGALLLYRRSAA